MSDIAHCKKCSRSSSSTWHLNVCPIASDPPPPPSLGSELKSVADVKRWLAHPSNHLTNDIFIVKWIGNVPKLAQAHVETLWEDPGLAEVIFLEHIRRKRGLSLTKSMEEREE